MVVVMLGLFRRNKEEMKDIAPQLAQPDEEFVKKAVQITMMLQKFFDDYTAPLEDLEQKTGAEAFNEVFSEIVMTKTVFALGYYSFGVAVLLDPIIGDSEDYDSVQAGMLAARVAIDAMDVPTEEDNGTVPRLYELAHGLMHYEPFKYAFEAGQHEGGALAAQITSMYGAPDRDELGLLKAVTQTMVWVTSLYRRSDF